MRKIIFQPMPWGVMAQVISSLGVIVSIWLGISNSSYQYSRDDALVVPVGVYFRNDSSVGYKPTFLFQLKNIGVRPAHEVEVFFLTMPIEAGKNEKPSFDGTDSTLTLYGGLQQEISFLPNVKAGTPERYIGFFYRYRQAPGGGFEKGSIFVRAPRVERDNTLGELAVVSSQEEKELRRRIFTVGKLAF